MQEYQSETTTELAKALLSVQKLLQPATKDATNPFVNKRYASLNSIMDVCKEPLISNGIWLCQYPVPVANEQDRAYSLGLVTKLTHAESGQWQASLSVIPLPKADPQGMGSAITYARRYALSAMLGIVTEDDFDGEQNKMPRQTQYQGQQTRRQNPPRPPQNQNDNHNQQHQNVQRNSGQLPMLNGVIYESIETTDEQGVLRETIIAKGNTIPNKGFLMQEGFRWNPQQKYWWRFANVA